MTDKLTRRDFARTTSIGAAALAAGGTAASSQALAQRYLAGLQFDTAILTNLRHDHLDFHGSVANYRRAKARLMWPVIP